LFTELRQASRADIPSIIRIENSSFPDPWPSDLFEECVRPSVGVRTWLARSSGRIVGYVCAALPVEGILHIANLCVVRAWRRRGIARSLLDVVEGWGLRLGARHSYLEVRSSNKAALTLYAGRGYSPCEYLPDYYGTGRSGLRLVRRLPESQTASARASIADALAGFLGRIPPVGVVLGSGLSWISGLFPRKNTLDLSDVPGASTGGVAGHPGLLVRSRNGRFAFLVGRRHRYQGFGGDEIALLPSILADLGTRTWLLTCSAGATAPGLRIGDAVAMRDSINLSGCVPSGPGRCGGSLFSSELRGLASACAREAGSPLRSGIFACVSGPAYETPAEIQLLRDMGVDAVSMSTVPEALALSSAGCDVLGLAFISNVADPEHAASHEEVLAASGVIEKEQRGFVRALLERLADHELR
jgi:purine-nucleoside phosphorylase